MTFESKCSIIKLSYYKERLMSDSICCFLPVKNEEAAVKTVRFVYETEFSKLVQPFVSPIYVVYIVTQGSAVLHI